MDQTSVDRLVLWGFIVSGFIAILIVGSVIALAVIDAFLETVVEIPSVLENWGGVVVGFYFGTFVSLIKDYMRLKQDEQETDGDAPPGEPGA